MDTKAPPPSSPQEQEQQAQVEGTWWKPPMDPQVAKFLLLITLPSYLLMAWVYWHPPRLNSPYVIGMLVSNVIGLEVIIRRKWI